MGGPEQSRMDGLVFEQMAPVPHPIRRDSMPRPSTNRRSFARDLPPIRLSRQCPERGLPPAFPARTSLSHPAEDETCEMQVDVSWKTFAGHEPDANARI